VLPPGADDDATVASMPVNLELEQLRGHHGRTISSLRPAGVTDFDGRRVDTMSEGPLIEAGKWVRCIDVRAGKVIVREVDAPPAMENLDFGELT
jgi:membrane-bound serine protease (ClpP class)